VGSATATGFLLLFDVFSEKVFISLRLIPLRITIILRPLPLLMLPSLHLITILSIEATIFATLLIRFHILISSMAEPQALPALLIMLVAQSLAPALSSVKITFIQRFLVRCICSFMHLAVFH